MKSLVIIFSMFLAFNVTAKTQFNSVENSELNIEYVNLENELFDLEQVVFEDLITDTVEVNDIETVEVEEEVELNFDTKEYLPARFNAKKGMHDLDWSTIELVEIEEEIDLGMNAKKELPQIDCKSKANVIIVSRL